MTNPPVKRETSSAELFQIVNDLLEQQGISVHKSIDSALSRVGRVILPKTKGMRK
jgi:uncharacterized membrane protein (DUF373 family)